MARAKSPDRRIDELFGLPLGEFVSARNALAAELTSAGDADAALRVRTLAKPSVSAWVVNQLYRKQSDAFDALLEAGRRMRKAQRALLAGASADALKEATKAEQKALARLTQHARAVLGDAGLAVTDTTLDRVETTLRAIARVEDPESIAGQLTRDLEPAGFEALVGSQAETVATPPARAPAKRQASAPRQKQKKKEPSREREQRAAAKRMLERAERAEKALTRDTKRAKRSSAAAAKLLARAKQDLAASERRHERAQVRHEAARRAVEEGAELERTLAQRLTETKHQVEAARALERGVRKH